MNTQTVLLIAAVLVLAYAVIMEWRRFVRFVFTVIVPILVLAGLYFYAVRMVR